MGGRNRSLQARVIRFARKSNQAVRAAWYLRCRRGAVDDERAALCWPAGRFPPPVGDEGAAAIPPYIFQTWKSKVEFPPLYGCWMSTFVAKNPGFRHIVWDDRDNRDFIEQLHPWFLPIYDTYPREIYRADAVRYFFLYTFGGIYADMDAECLKPLDELRYRGDVLLGRMGNDLDFQHSIPNATMASKPREEFWLLVIWTMLVSAQQMPLREPDYATGPVILKSALDLYMSDRLVARLRVRYVIDAIARLLPADLKPIPRKSQLVMLPDKEWFPIDWSDPADQPLRRKILENGPLDEVAKARLFPDSSVVSYWTHSW